MLTDYKFWYIKKEDDVHISECAVRFYEGAVTTENEMNSKTRLIEPVTRYRRSRRLESNDLSHLGTFDVKLENSGVECVVFTAKDFGVITKEDDLKKFLNQQIKKDTSRVAIDEQKV